VLLLLLKASKKKRNLFKLIKKKRKYLRHCQSQSMRHSLNPNQSKFQKKLNMRRQKKPTFQLIQLTKSSFPMQKPQNQ
jgi:hypothetical protein